MRNSVSGLSSSLFALRSNIKTVGDVENEVSKNICSIFILVKNLGHNLVKGNFIWEMRPYTLMTLLTGSAMYKPITIFTLLIIWMYAWPYSIIIDCYEGEPAGEEYDKPFISGEKQFKDSV